MSWWRCHLCHRSQAVDNPGAVWWEHYMAEHFQACGQVSVTNDMDYHAPAWDNGSAPASGKLPGRDRPLSGRSRYV